MTAPLGPPTETTRFIRPTGTFPSNHPMVSLPWTAPGSLAWDRFQGPLLGSLLELAKVYIYTAHEMKFHRLAAEG